jgi:hypothetical protein
LTQEDDFKGGWRELYKEDFRDLYSSSGIVSIIKSRRMMWLVQVARLVEKRYTYGLLAGNPEGKRPLGKPKCKWVYTINKNLAELRWKYVEAVGLPQNRNKWRALVKALTTLRIL